MILSGNNFLSISRQTGLSFNITLNPADLTEKELGFSGIGPNFSIKLINNKIFDPNQKVISTINLNEAISISGDIFQNKYNLYLNEKVISFNRSYNFNYFDHFYFKSITNTDISDLSIKGTQPQVTINIPNSFNVGENVNCSINVNNLSAKIYSGQINDLSSGSKSSFVLSTLPNNGSGNFQIKTTGAIQDVDFKNYPIELNLYTNFGTIKRYYNITGKYQEYQPFVELINIIDADNFPIGESGRSVYRLEYEISSGENIIPPDISLSFAYHNGYTGLEQASVQGTGSYNINYTGNIVGSGNVNSLANTSYNLTGRNVLTNTDVSGDVSLNLSKFIYLNGNLTNNITLAGTGLRNASVVNDEDFQATGINFATLNASGNVFISGNLTGSVNNQPATGISYILSTSGGVFTDLNLVPLNFSSYSGIINTGYLIANDYFTGNVGTYSLGNSNSTGILTGKNETLFIYSGNNLSGLFTGNLYGSGDVSVQENYSLNQRVTGVLSGDISQRQIILDLPTINLSRFTYFTGNYTSDLSIPIVGTASGKDQNNLEVITNVTGRFGISSGFTFNSNDSGVKYVVLNNFISKNPVELANYTFTNDFNSSNINSSFFINNIFSNRQKTLLGITSSVMFQNGVNNSISFYTGFNNQWTNIWNLSTGYLQGPMYNPDPNVFGAKIAFDYSGNNIIVGCDRCDDQYPTSVSQGQVFTYTRNNNQITTGSRITLGSPYNSYRTKARFGFDIDIDDSGNSLIVGAPSYRYCTGLNNSLIFDCLESNVHASDLGAAFLYKKQNNSWVLEAGFSPTNITGFNSWAQFGHSVAINRSGNLVAITSLAENQSFSGALYIYEKTGDSWNLSHKRSGIYGGGKKVEFDKNSNILIYHNGVPREWSADNFAFVLNGNAAVESIGIIENKTGTWDNIGFIYTGNTSTINNFTITDSSKLVFIHTGQQNLADQLDRPTVGRASIRSNGSGGQLMDIWTVPGRRYLIRSGPSLTALANPIVAEISSATGYKSTVNNPVPFAQWTFLAEDTTPTSPKFLIYNISGNYETEITGNSNFTTIDTQDSYFVSNDLTNFLLISGGSDNLIQATRSRDFVKNMKADYSHLGLRATNIAYQSVPSWTPLNTFVNLPSTLTILGSGNVSFNHTGNYTGLQINNKTLLNKSQQGGANPAAIAEINSKLFTGVWSGTGIISSTNENVSFIPTDSGIKTIVGIKTGIPASFNLINSLGNSYQSEVFRSGNFSGYFSGNVFGSGMVYRTISGYPTGIIKSGSLISGLYFNTGVFNQNISGNVSNGIMIYDNIVTGINNGNPLTGRVNSIIATGSYSSGFLEQVTGTILNGVSYLKTFSQSFSSVKTGLDFINRTDLALMSNIYTGNLLSAPQQTIYIEVVRAPSYNYINTMSGKLDVKLSTIHGNITTGVFIDL